jgi:hypothetical protein
MLVSVTSTTLMHLVHDLGWNLAFSVFGGMAAAMVIQVLLAMCVAPVLGSIESMGPSMVVAMASPMAICSLDLFRINVERRGAAGLGAAIGLAMFVVVEAYGLACRRRFRRVYDAA